MIEKIIIRAKCLLDILCIFSQKLLELLRVQLIRLILKQENMIIAIIIKVILVKNLRVRKIFLDKITYILLGGIQ